MFGYFASVAGKSVGQERPQKIRALVLAGERRGQLSPEVRLVVGRNGVSLQGVIS